MEDSEILLIFGAVIDKFNPKKRKDMAEPKTVTPFVAVISGVPAVRHLSYYNRIKKRVQGFVIDDNEELVPQRFKTIFETFKTCLTAEDALWKKSQASDYTPQIQEADANRDTYVSGIHAGLNYYHFIGTEQEKQAADRILAKWQLYKISTADKYEDEGEKLSQLDDDVTNDIVLSQAVTLLNMTAHFAQMKQYNERCINLINQRNWERAGTEKKAMENARKATDAAYKALVASINSFADVYFGDEGLGQLFEQCITAINADIDYYKRYVLPKPVGDDEDPDADPEPQPQPDPSGGDDQGGGDDGGEVTPVTPE